MEAFRFAVLTHIPFNTPMYDGLFEQEDYRLDHFIIDYSQPLLGVPQLLKQGYEAVLLYSSFGNSLLRNIGHCLALVQKTDSDIIRALLQAREISSTAVLSLHDEENLDVEFLERLCNMRIHAVRYDTMETLRQKNAEAYDRGERVFVGGGVTSAMGVMQDARYIPVLPAKHSILQALELARGLAQARRNELEARNQLVAILRLFPEGVVCVNRDGHLVFYNDRALDILRIPRKQKQDLASYFPQLMITEVLEDGQPREDVIRIMHDERIILSTLPVMIHSNSMGAVAFLHDANTLRTMSGKLRERRISGFYARYFPEDFKGKTSEAQLLRKMVSLYAQHLAPVLIHGETGTGKEVLAQAIHNAGPRKDEPFVALNCAALPDSLLESELFGYEEGAFTGARKEGKPGVFEMAHKGTIFLDEIGDMGTMAQLRLLRTLETREVMRIGGNRMIPVDVRVISASHRQLNLLMQEGGFRQDLFYRLAVLRMHVPPLRQRFEDIPLLLEETLLRYGRKKLPAALSESLKTHIWPGNVRELTAFVESYLILLDKRADDAQLFMDLLRDRTLALFQDREFAKEHHGKADLKIAETHTRLDSARKALKECAGSKKLAAARLGISYNTLWRILKNG